MLNTSKLSALFGGSALALLLTVGHASALDLAKFEASVKNLYSAPQMEITWDKIEGDDSKVTISGTVMKINTGAPAGAADDDGDDEDNGDDAANTTLELKLGDSTFTNISEQDDGFHVGSVENTDLTWNTKDFGPSDGSDVVINISGISGSGLILPYADAAKGPPLVLFHDNVTIKNINVDEKGKTIASLTNLHSSASPSSGDEKNIVFKSGVENFNIDMTALPNSEKVRELGYDGFTGSAISHGAWNLTTGKLSAQESSIDVKDVGKLTIAFDINGLTEGLMTQLREAQANMANATEEQATQTALGMMGIISPITFGNILLRFDDASLTEKIIAKMAKDENTTTEEIKGHAKAVLPMILGALGDPDFSKSTSKAVEDFLDNPKSIFVEAKPATPLPIMQIVASATMAPASLIKQFGLMVGSN